MVVMLSCCHDGFSFDHDVHCKYFNELSYKSPWVVYFSFQQFSGHRFHSTPRIVCWLRWARPRFKVYSTPTKTSTTGPLSSDLQVDRSLTQSD